MTIPIKIMILQGSSKLIKISGKKIREKSPSVMIASVYIVRFSISETVTATPEIPSLCINQALAGCPPVADGVIDEK